MIKYVDPSSTKTQGRDIRNFQVVKPCNVDGMAQPAASQISAMDTVLDHAQDEVMPLVEWKRTPKREI